MKEDKIMPGQSRLPLSNSYAQFFSGTSGLVLPIPRTLYPLEFQGKSRLTYYASLFNSVEINRSFYKTPQAATINKWMESVPSDFRFTFKLSKTITHARGFEFVPEDVTAFMQSIAATGKRKGCLLIQFAPSFAIEKLSGLKKLLTCIEDATIDNSWKLAIEFRNVSWYQAEAYDLLQQHKACMVIHDLPASATPLNTARDGVVYLRFHGPGGRYRGSYSDEALQEYAAYIRQCLAERKTVYAYFNNTMGDAVKNLQKLNALLQSHLA